MSEKPTICFLKGKIFHLWHGDNKKRQYKERREIFKSVKDVRDIIKVADNGLFEIKDSTLKSKIRKYFKNRDDDGLAMTPTEIESKSNSK
jgi:predicted glycosyltransferase involved in capsule biosynthesis